MSMVPPGLGYDRLYQLFQSRAHRPNPHPCKGIGLNVQIGAIEVCERGVGGNSRLQPQAQNDRRPGVIDIVVSERWR